MKNYNRRSFLQTSTLGAIATSSLSINCQKNLNSERLGYTWGAMQTNRLRTFEQHLLE